MPAPPGSAAFDRRPLPYNLPDSEGDPATKRLHASGAALGPRLGAEPDCTQGVDSCVLASFRLLAHYREQEVARDARQIKRRRIQGPDTAIPKIVAL